MSDLYWPKEEHMARLRPYFRKSYTSPGLMIAGCK